jgi:DNA-binding NtrC family response regulator
MADDKDIVREAIHTTLSVKRLEHSFAGHVANFLEALRETMPDKTMNDDLVFPELEDSEEFLEHIISRLRVIENKGEKNG